MSDLAPFVLAFMRDEVIERLMEENKKLRSILRYVMVKFVAPRGNADSEELDDDGLFTYWRQRVDVLEAANDEDKPALDLSDDYFYYPMVLADIHQGKVRVGELHSTKALGEYPCSVFVTDCRFHRERHMMGALRVRLEFQVGEGETIIVHGSVGCFHNRYSVQHYSHLSGMPMEDVLSKLQYNEDGLGSFPEEEKPEPFRVELDVLSGIFVRDGFPVNFHVEVFGVEVPFKFIKEHSKL